MFDDIPRKIWRHSPGCLVVVVVVVVVVVLVVVVVVIFIYSGI